MVVEFLDGLTEADNLPERAVLKVYDRRCAAKLRSEHMLDEWNPETESEFTKFVQSGSANTFVNMLQQEPYPEEPDPAWNTAQCETYLHTWCSDMFATELKMYRRLESLQGRHIPRLFTSVVLSEQSNSTNPRRIQTEELSTFQIPGILIEHIVGHPLPQIPDFVKPRHWQDIVGSAFKVIHALSDAQVLNEGIKSANIIVCSPNTKEGDFRLVMVDLTQCIARESGQSDDEWVRQRADEDEEGTIAREMSERLAKVGFELQYASSNRFH